MQNTGQPVRMSDEDMSESGLVTDETVIMPDQPALRVASEANNSSSDSRRASAALRVPFVSHLPKPNIGPGAFQDLLMFDIRKCCYSMAFS